MCGFTFKTKVGISREQNSDTSRYELEAQDLTHRGPDQNLGVKTSDCEMRFFRLAIRDLEGGQQPFMPSENVYSMLNGELYNESEIRKILIESGSEDLPSGDMNLVAYFLCTFGIQSINKLDGMFAGVMYDSTNEIVTIFRDKIGEKPLYYHLSPRHLYISSEMFWTKEFKSRNTSDLSTSVCSDSILRGIWPDQEQFGNEMKSLSPGCYALVDLKLGSISFTSYWSWPKRRKSGSHREAINPEYFLRLEGEVEKAVVSRLVSDYPIATLLSGGIDSGLITAMANKNKPGNLTAFTLDFKDSTYSELSASCLTAKHIGINHQVVSLSNKDLAQLTYQTVAAMDVPILDPGALSLFAITKYLGQEFKVALSGDGGDELFMGYTLFSYMDQINLGIKMKPIAKIGLRALIALTSLHKYSYLSLNMKFQRMESLLCDSPLSPIEASLSPFAGTPIFKHLASKFPNFEFENITEEGIERYYREHVLPKLYLVKSDRMSMRHGVELRSPFLSPGLIEIAKEWSSTYTIQKSTKFPLRKIAESYLPKKVFELPKHGFSSPFSEVRTFLPEPKWEIDSLGISRQLASKVWNTKNENSGIASWSLLVLNEFNKR